MKRLLAKYREQLSLEQLVWFLILFTLPLSIRLNSLAIVLGIVVFIIFAIKKYQRKSNDLLIHLTIPVLLFLIFTFGVYNELTNFDVVKELEQKLPLIAIPVLFVLGSINSSKFKQASLAGLIISLLLAGILMLTESCLEYLETHNYSVFTYHQLTEPFSIGAIFFSFFLVVILLQITEVSWLLNLKKLRFVIIAFFVLLLFLSTSKLMMVLGLPILIFRYWTQIKVSLLKNKKLIPILVLGLSLMTIPTILRIKQISDPNLSIVFADKYYYDSPLNGLNLRIIQARLGLEILSENESWLTGVGISKSQYLLNNKYLEYGIYTGYSGTPDTGYLNYNFHNQFVEILVRSGIIGLLLLLFMFLMIIKIPLNRRFVSNWIIFLIFMFFLTESVLERQQGIVYFCIIYSSYYPRSLNLSNTNEL